MALQRDDTPGQLDGSLPSPRIGNEITGETTTLDTTYFQRMDAARQARLAAPPLSDDELARLRAAHPDQAWFWTPEWQAGEREVDENIATGPRSTIYDSDEEFQAALDRIPPADADV